ncbi:MAG: class I SAM-dependent methyltransferase [Myxococcaceae bacterium]
MSVDFGRTADDYAKYRHGFPDALFDRLFTLGVARAGQRALDLGTGTGTIARGLARRGLNVLGLDPAEPMLEQARALSVGLPAEYRVGRAEETGVPDRSFDLVTAGQCWHWFDRARAAAEAMRLLVPGGSLVIAHMDWLSLPGNCVELTEALFEELAGGNGWPAAELGFGVGVYPYWLKDVARFERIETFSFDVALPYSQEAWRGRVRASAAIGARLPRDRVAEFDARLASELGARFQDPLSVPHRIWALIARRPS